MPTYLELKAKLERLAQQAEEARVAEMNNVIASIRIQIAEYGITPDHLFGRRKPEGGGARGLAGPKYRDPTSGATWNGRGRRPRWIVSAKNPELFLISDTEKPTVSA